MKQSQNNNFDQFIKGKLEDASVEAPAFIWDEIERKLPPVLPWYSKYKYLLALLLLCFTSATSILTYKYLKNDKLKSIAITNSKLVLGNNVNTNNNTTTKIEEYLSIKNRDANSNTINHSDSVVTKNEKNTVSVNSFYTDKKENSVATKNTTLSELEKRNKRISRFDTKNEIASNTKTTSLISANKNLDSKTIKHKKTTTASVENNAIVSSNSSTDFKNQQSKKIIFEDINANNNLENDTNNIAPKKSTEKISQNKFLKNTISKDLLADNTSTKKANFKNNKSNSISNKSRTNSIATSDENSNNNSIDISLIVEPIQTNESEQLIASVTPLKLNTTPLKSRDVLRSLIEPNKLEMLDFAAAAGVEDLNPNKEKMLRNLKQFAGYNINRGFHIGAFISINNIWLSNKKFSSSENVTSIKPKIDFGKSYGLNIGYDYSNHWGFETEIQYAEQGQKYTESNVNGNSSKEVNLNYLKLPLLMKYKQSFINNYNSKPIVMSFLFGPQMGFLLKKEMLYNNSKVDCTQNYSKVEAGLAAGIDFDLYMMRYMYLTIGARTGFGTSFKKGVPVSYQLGITTQFNFRIPKKLK